MTRILSYSGLVLVTGLLSCSEVLTGPGGNNPGSDDVLTARSSVFVRSSRIEVIADSAGTAKNLLFFPSGLPPFMIAESAGLWLAHARQGVEASVLSGLDDSLRSNMISDEGAYLVSQDSLDNLPVDWPLERGAPIDAFERAALLGEEMGFTFLKAQRNWDGPPAMSRPSSEILVSSSIYVSSQTGLDNVVFVRYSFFNSSSSHLDQVRAGFHVNFDLESVQASHPCGGDLAEYGASGFNENGGFGYSYVHSSAPVPEECRSIMASVFFLETAEENRQYDNVHASMMLREEGSPLGFELDSYTSPEAIWNTLGAWSTDGSRMMTHPITEEPTRFAFTGDPVDGTGWLDIPGDSHSLIAAPSFPLGPHLFKEMTVGILIVQGSSFADALATTKAQVPGIRSTWGTTVALD